ncbi:MAG: CoA-transferase [Candidatus Bathyarchaeia archaeon]
MEKIYAKDYTTPELIAANIARQLEDWGLGHVGVTRGRGRSYTYVVGIPQVAIMLAKMMGYAPHYTWIETVTFNRRIDEVRSVDEIRSEKIRSEGIVGTWPNLVNPGLEHNPKLTDAFSAGAQIDKYGNVNCTFIGDYRKPKVFLGQCQAQPEQLMFADTSWLLQHTHERRVFTEKVDFITSVGYLNGGDSREKAGLPPKKAIKVFSNLAALGFDEKTKRMKLVSVHPGVTVEEVKENTGFELIIPETVPETEPPTMKEVELVRTKIDPHRLFLTVED